MAQADNRKGLSPWHPEDAEITMWPIKTAQTLTEGDAVILSSNQVAIAVAGSARLLGVIARDCASLTAGTDVPVYDKINARFVARQDGSDTLTVGTEYDLVGATGAMQIDSDASSTDVFRTIKEVDGGESDAAGKRWVVMINKHENAVID